MDNRWTFLEWINTNFQRLEENGCCYIVMVCWSLWNARSEKVWNNKFILLHNIIDEANVFLQNWREVNQGNNYLNEGD